MKKVFLGLIIGIVLGSITTWSLLQSAKKESSEEHVSESEKHEVGVHLSSDQLSAAGIVISNPQTARIFAETKSFGRVLDPAPLAVLWTELVSTEAAASASKREWERLKSLGENASARAFESAEASMKRDVAAHDSARGRLIAGWGKSLASRTNLPTLIHALLSQEIALARADLTAGEKLESPPSQIRFAESVGGGSLQPAEWIGPAPTADLQAQGQAFLILLHGQPPPPGTALSVLFTGNDSHETGFLLPAAAVVQHDNGTFVYIQTGEGQFERKAVDLGSPQADGVVVIKGIKTEDRVVMTGAQQLLSEEFKAANGGE